jgi:tetratricopeptide (TPR) repeat protein
MKVLNVLWVVLSCGIGLAQTAPANPTPIGRVEALGRLMSASMEVAKNDRVERQVRQRGLNFSPTEDYLRSVKTAGGSEALLEVLRRAGQSEGQYQGRTSPPESTTDNDTETLTHLERGIDLWDQHSFNDAAKELRTALKIGPDNAYLHLSLATVLLFKHDKKAAIEECRRAIQLQPDCVDAHVELARLLDSPKDPAQAMPEY